MFLVNELYDSMVIVNLDTQSHLSVINGRIRIEPLNISICSGETNELNDKVSDIVNALKANVNVYDLRDPIGSWKPKPSTHKSKTVATKPKSTG